MSMRAALLAGALLTIGGGTSFAAETSGANAVVANSAAVRVFGGATARTEYASGEAALLAGDLDAYLSRARAAVKRGESSAPDLALVIMDEVASGRVASARSILAEAPDRYRDGVSALVHPWILLADGDGAEGLKRAEFLKDQLPSRLGPIQAALVAEVSGDMAAAERIYAELEAQLDLVPPSRDEANTVEEAMRQLGAPQTVQILYRQALLKHRVGQYEDAGRIYDVVEKFAPNAPDVAANKARAARRDAPVEPRLDLMRGLGRWALFLSEEFGRADGLALAIAREKQEGLVSPVGSMFGLAGVAYDTSAHDWALSSAFSLLAADGLAGAERVFARVPNSSLFAADARLGLAETALRRKDDARAVKEAEAARRLAPERWTVSAGAASIFARAGRERPTIASYDAALRLADRPKDRANILVGRAGANHYFGNLDQAVADARAAKALDDSPNIRIAMVAYLLDHPNGWEEAVRIGRELLQEQPESVSRLNQLGYTLIHRPEGLEEGYRLLSRGAALGPNDFAVIDSLGWAYYQYGDFEEALRLIEQSHKLSDEPVAEVLDHLGDVYWRLGQEEQARDAWRQGLDARPESRRRRSLETKIASGLTTPAPERRQPPRLEPFTPGQRTDT